MRICVDLDGTICEYKTTTGDYATVQPLPGAAETIKNWRASGHYIIINTARHMKTTGGNVGLIIARQAQTLLSWLDQHGIEYDELQFGKPHADLYIDDNAIRFDGNWDALRESGAWDRPSMEAAGKINIILTMAGAGSRFRRIGHDLPKPLIPAFGEPMYRHAVRSLPLHLAARFIVIILDDEYADEMEEDILRCFGDHDPVVIRLPSLTRGQAETMLAASPAMSFNLPVLIHNADSAYLCPAFESIYRSADGGLLVFDSDEPRWSFVAVDDTGRVTEVREKTVISRHASTGTYYFRSSVQAMALARAAINANETEKGEFYIAPLYNRMIAAGQNLALIPVQSYVCYGTPEDLALAEADPAQRKTIEELATTAKTVAQA